MELIYSWLPPEKAHLALALLPLHGLTVATLALLLATAIGRRGVLIVSLVLVLLTCASIVPVVDSGEAARQAIDQRTDPSEANALETDEWLDRYQRRAEFWSWPILGIAGLSIIAIGLAAWRPRDIGRYAGGVTSLLCIGGIAALAWVANAGIDAYYPDARPAHAGQPDIPPDHDKHTAPDGTFESPEPPAAETPTTPPLDPEPEPVAPPAPEPSDANEPVEPPADLPAHDDPPPDPLP